VRCNFLRTLSKGERGTLVLLTLCAALIRFFRLDFQSLWYDEMQTGHFLQNSYLELFESCLLYDANPPLFYFVTKMVTVLFGFSETTLRFSSALFGSALIPLVYFSARKMFDARVALWAAIWATSSFALIYYSQEARAYAMMTTLCYGTLLSYLYFSEKPHARSFFGVLGVLAVFTHYYSYFFLAALFLDSVRTKKWRASVYLILQVIVSLPWLWMVHTRERGYQSIAWIAAEAAEAGNESNVLKGLAGLFKSFFIPQWNQNPDLSLGYITLVLTALFLVYVIGRKTLPYRTQILRWFGVAVVMVALVSLIDAMFITIFHPRYFVFLIPLFWILLAAACQSIKYRWVPSLLLGVTVLSQASLIHHYLTQPQKEQAREAIRSAREQDPQAFILPCPFRRYLFSYYIPMDRNDLQLYQIPSCTFPQGVGRVWFVFLTSYGTPAPEPKDFLTIGRQMISRQSFYGVELYYLSEKMLGPSDNRGS
jgi:mannosyltransferase